MKQSRFLNSLRSFFRRARDPLGIDFVVDDLNVDLTMTEIMQDLEYGQDKPQRPKAPAILYLREAA